MHWGEWKRRAETGDKHEDQYCDPMISKESFFRGEQVSGKVDHAPNLDVGTRHYVSIVELVTDAKDETADDCLAPMKEAVALAEKIDGKIVSAGVRLPVAEVLGSSLDSSLSLGANLFPTERQFQNTEAYAQATYGVKLGSVGKLFSQRAGQHGHVNRDGSVYEQTISAMTSLLKPLAELGIDHQKTPHLMGYLELACLYLVGGSPDHRTSGVAKNAVPLLLRERFDTMRSATVPSHEANLISEAEVRQKLKTALLEATRREAGQGLYPGSPISAGDWLKAVLAGETDKAWAAWDSSREVRSEQVGPDKEMAPVLEERNPPPAGTRLKPGSWIDFAEQRRKELVQLNAPSGPTTPQKDTGVLPSARLDLGSSSDKKPVGRAVKDGEVLKKGDLVFLPPDGREGTFMMYTGPKNTECYAKWIDPKEGEKGAKFAVSALTVP